MTALACVQYSTVVPGLDPGTHELLAAATPRLMSLPAAVYRIVKEINGFEQAARR